MSAIAQLNNLQDTATSAFSDISKTVGGLLFVNFSSELLNKGNKTPAFSISIEGRDITTVLDNRLMSLTLTDNRGFEADQLIWSWTTLTEKSCCRAVVRSFGWHWVRRGSRFPKGAFTVDEIEHAGTRRPGLSGAKC